MDGHILGARRVVVPMSSLGTRGGGGHMCVYNMHMSDTDDLGVDLGGARGSDYYGSNLYGDACVGWPSGHLWCEH
ncbi:hypothetical protein AMTR_s00047p00188720 [Amborella trichopoda]|uniref:Uncharacterized protein n=1 Tax=Amborella trichopoda TaxID=13333 RepID=U5CWX4_AMBTC|nr:hypothetical protein AMTR_s00047p00188720 [Amborella trichopoda]